MEGRRKRREFSEEFKIQMVSLYNGGKSIRDICREYDLTRSALSRWCERINATGSSRIADNRTEQENRLIALEKENKQLRMENEILKLISADIRTKVSIIAGNADRYPISAQCEILGTSQINILLP